MSTRKISRRTFLRISTLAAAGAVSAACAQTTPAPTAAPVKAAPTSAPPATTAPAAKAAPTSAPAATAAPAKKAISPAAQGQLPVPRDETVVHSMSSQFAVFDAANPFIPNGIHLEAFVQVWEVLFYRDFFAQPGKEVVPWLAESWKYSEDYKTLSIKVRKGVTWNDGKPFTAADVLFTMQMLLKNDKLSGAGSLIANVDKVESPDDLTVVLSLKKSLPRFHYRFVGGTGSVAFPIVPKHVWENQDPLSFKNFPPVLTGPYKIKQAYPDLKMILWERRDDYWGKALGYFPKPKYIAFRQPSSAAQELLDLQQGTVDIAQGIDWPIYQTALKGDATLGYSTTPDPNPRGHILNCWRPPFDKAEFRWAVSYLCNYEKYGTVIWQPPTTQSKGPFAPYPAMDRFRNKEILAKYKLEFNPQKAAAKFDELGYKVGADGKRKTPDGKDLTIDALGYYAVASPPMEMLNDLAAEAKKIGITMNVRRAEQPVIEQSVFAGDFDIYVRAIIPGAPDPYDLYFWFANTREGQTVPPVGERAGWNWGRLKDPVLDDIVAKLGAINPDAPAAAALYDAGFEQFMKQLPGIPLVDFNSLQCWSKRFWTNWPTQGNYYNSAGYWWGTWLFTLLKLEPAA